MTLVMEHHITLLIFTRNFAQKWSGWVEIRTFFEMEEYEADKN